MTLDAKVDAYIRELQENLHRAETTIVGHRAELHELRARGIDLAAGPLATFVREGRAGQALAASTRNRRLCVLRAFTGYLVRGGFLESDPTADIAWTRLPPSRRTAFTVPELQRAMAVFRAEEPTWQRIRDEAAFEILFQTGLRISELTGLDLGQVSVSEGVLRRVRRKGGGILDIVLNDEACAAFRRWLRVRPASASATVFIGGYRQHRLTVRHFQRRFVKVGLAAGLGSGLTPHSLRHAHATALLRLGISLEIIRQSLNHTSVRTTQLYLHTDDEILREALGQMPSLTDGP